jgi:hypothetical protein
MAITNIPAVFIFNGGGLKIELTIIGMMKISGIYFLDISMVSF